jgi:hypothetical protein
VTAVLATLFFSPPKMGSTRLLCAVAGAVEQFQPGVPLQVPGDGAGVVDAVVIADHHDDGGAGNASGSIRAKAMKSAAQRRPSR